MVSLDRALQILKRISTPEQYRDAEELADCVEDLHQVLDELEIPHEAPDFIDFARPGFDSEGDERMHYFAQLDEMTVELFSKLSNNNIDEALAFFQSHVTCFRHTLNRAEFTVNVMTNFADPSLLRTEKEIIIENLTSKGATTEAIDKFLTKTFEDEMILDLWTETSPVDKEKSVTEIEFMRTLIDVAPHGTRFLEEFHEKENIFSKLTVPGYGNSFLGLNNLTCEEFRESQRDEMYRRVAPAKIDFIVEQFLALGYTYADIFTDDIIQRIANGICEYLDDFILAKWINEYPPLRRVVELVRQHRPLAYHDLLVYLMDYETETSERTLEILEREFVHGQGTQMIDVVRQQNDLTSRRLRNSRR